MKYLPALLLIFSLIFPTCQPEREAPGPPVRLDEDVEEIIRVTLESMAGPVSLHLYLGGTGETAAPETRAILEFMAVTSPQITLLDYSLDPAGGDADPGFSPEVEHGPVVRIDGTNKGSLFFYGLPERKELPPFLDGVLMASGYPTDLPPDVQTFLSGIDHDVQIRIFTSPD
jgi:hypothetical protein